jgi:hypothetical protein
MVTYYNRKDLVSFGTYLLSEIRKSKIISSYMQDVEDGIKNPYPLFERLKAVHNADIQNWIEENCKENR